MSTNSSFPTNPQRRERLLNLADFRRNIGTEASKPAAEAQEPSFSDEKDGDERAGAAPAD